MRFVRAAVLLAAAMLLGVPRADAADACAESYEAGQRARRDGELSRAKVELARCSRECSERVRPDCARWLEEVEALMPSVVVVARDEAGHDVELRELSIDGRTVTRWAQSIDLDPGVHEVFAEGAGRRGHHRILVREGEKRRVVVLTLARPSVAAAPGEPLADRAGRRLTPPVVVAGALSALGFAAFGVVAATGEARYARLEQCRPHCEPADVSSLRSAYTLGDVALGVGIVSAGVAAVLYLASAEASGAR